MPAGKAEPTPHVRFRPFVDRKWEPPTQEIHIEELLHNFGSLDRANDDGARRRLRDFSHQRSLKRCLLKAGVGKGVSEIFAQLAWSYLNARNWPYFGIPSENFRQQRRVGRGQSYNSVEARRR